MLQLIVDGLIYQVLGLDEGARWVGVLHFFIYDSLKIMLLLTGMITVIGFFRTFISQNQVKQWLTGKGPFGHLYAALFGALTPFCSCSSIPIFLSFIRAGVPLGFAFSFLIASPLINEYLVVLMVGFFGIKITLCYVLSGIVIGIIVGLMIGQLGLERFLVQDMQGATEEHAQERISGIWPRIQYGAAEAWTVVRKVWLWVLLGVGLGAFIHNYVPQEFIQDVIKRTGPWSVPIATVLGVPMYGSCAAIVPVAVVLFRKGIPLGTALAFMMGTAALSLPEAVILRRAMRLPLILLFFAITTVGIILIGYLFNALQQLLVS